MTDIPDRHDLGSLCTQTANYLDLKLNLLKDYSVIADNKNTNIWKVIASKREIILMEGYRCPDTEYILEQLAALGWRITDRT